MHIIILNLKSDISPPSPGSNIVELIKGRTLTPFLFRELQYLRHKIHLGLFLSFGLSAFSWIITIIITGCYITNFKLFYLVNCQTLPEKNFEIANIFPSPKCNLTNEHPFFLPFKYSILFLFLIYVHVNRTGSRDRDRHVHSGHMHSPPPHCVLPHHNILLDVY